MASSEISISVIVAVLNGASTLERCIKSVAAQTHRPRELIVMDGGSTDASPAIIDACQEDIAYTESKRDRGIYHAWNKALIHAGGDWICFLGADDTFAGPDVLRQLVPHLRSAAEAGIRVAYGRIAKVDKSGRLVRQEGRPWEKIRWLMRHGMPLPHPGLMHHRSLFDTHGAFDETFRIAGDYEFLLRELKSGRALYADGLRTVVCQVGGIADTSKLLAQREVARARRKNGLPTISWVWTAVYLRSLLREYLIRRLGGETPIHRFLRSWNQSEN